MERSELFLTHASFLKIFECFNHPLTDMAHDYHAAFRFFAAFFFWYSASRLSISLFGTAINALASFSNRWYSSLFAFDGGFFFI
jgi:hypothetical protein